MAKFMRNAVELRQTWELERVVFKYSYDHVGRRRAGAFVEKGLLNEIAEQNPQLSVVTVPFKRKPRVIGEYVGGYRRNMLLKEFGDEEILRTLNYLRDAGSRIRRKHNRLTRNTLTTRLRTVQGLWKGGPDLWKGSVPKTPIRDEDEKVQRKLFRQISSEIGREGVLKVLRGLRAKETRASKRLIAAESDKIAKPSRESLRAYYTDVYLPMLLEREKYDRSRGQPAASASTTASRKLVSPKGSSREDLEDDEDEDDDEDHDDDDDEDEDDDDDDDFDDDFEVDEEEEDYDEEDDDEGIADDEDDDSFGLDVGTAEAGDDEEQDGIEDDDKWDFDERWDEEDENDDEDEDPGKDEKILDLDDLEGEKKVPRGKPQ